MKNIEFNYVQASIKYLYISSRYLDILSCYPGNVAYENIEFTKSIFGEENRRDLICPLFTTIEGKILEKQKNL